MTTNEHTAFVVDRHSIFFYAGLINEEELETQKVQDYFHAQCRRDSYPFCPRSGHSFQTDKKIRHGK